MQYWLMKSEPNDYSIEALKKDGQTFWSGVRNYQARNNIREMKPGDLAFFYRSVKNPAIVGIMEIISDPYQDPTTDGDWSVVDVKFKKVFDKEISLKEIKAEKSLQEMRLVKQSRLSVAPVTKKEWEKILSL